MEEKKTNYFIYEENCCPEKIREDLYQRGLRLHAEGNAAEAAACFRQTAENILDALEDETAEEEEAGFYGAYMQLGQCLLALRQKERPHFAPSPLKCFEEAYGYAENRKDEGQAQFMNGYLHLFGIETKSDPEEGCALLEEAAGCGNTEAAALLEEVRSWEQIPADVSCSAGTEARKKEALLRLGILERMGVDPEVRTAFAERGTPGYASDDCYGFESFSADYYPEIQAAVEKLERRGVTVYFIHVSLSLSCGYMVSLFYVTDDPAEWPSDRRDLLCGTPIAAVTDLEEYYTEIGSIPFVINDNLMERRY